MHNEIKEKNKLLEEANMKLTEERKARLEIEKEKAKLEIEKEKMRLSLSKKQKFKPKIKPIIKFKPAN